MPAVRRANTLTHVRLALGMATFGSATPISKIVTSAMPVFIGSGLRVALGAAVLAPFAASSFGQIRSLTGRDWCLVALIAVFGMFGFSVLMLFGMRMTSGVTGAVVMSTTPAVTAAGSMLLMGDQVTWRKVVAVALGVIGVVLLQLGPGGGEGGGTDVLGAILVFAAVCCEAAYTLIGKVLADRADPVLIAFLGAALSVPLFVPFAVWQWNLFRVQDVGLAQWAALAWYGAGTLALGSWLWYSGLAAAEGAVAAGFMGIMPASALLLSYLLLGEPFHWSHLAGFAVVFCGVALISWEHAMMSRHPRRAADPRDGTDAAGAGH
ncbi:DMT family transporter [Inquilinus limosus]|uniref:DMT family transporter n=1 Tax=Inquilinus limosus TaxID=171674 RepID=UPI00068FCB5C|nr:DMT family transporter [Inquilinus limosus]